MFGIIFFNSLMCRSKELNVFYSTAMVKSKNDLLLIGKLAHRIHVYNQICAQMNIFYFINISQLFRIDYIPNFCNGLNWIVQMFVSYSEFQTYV